MRHYRPYDTPRQMENERTYRVENHLVYPRVGCAVMCRGLVSASHLNGVLGEMRDVKQDSTGTIRFGVHIEKIGASRRGSSQRFCACI